MAGQPEVDGAREAAEQKGLITIQASDSYVGRTEPRSISTYFENTWSDAGYLDLSYEPSIPPNATVTAAYVIYYDHTGHFADPEIALFDENGEGYYVNQLSGRTDGHNGKPVRQEWHVMFWTETIWQRPVAIWPQITLVYEY